MYSEVSDELITCGVIPRGTRCFGRELGVPMDIAYPSAWDGAGVSMRGGGGAELSSVPTVASMPCMSIGSLDSLRSWSLSCCPISFGR